MKVYAAYYLKFKGLDLRYNSQWDPQEVGLYQTKDAALQAALQAWADQLLDDDDARCFVHDLSKEELDKRRRWYVEEKAVSPE